ncbi:hypothetical protein J5N97_003487 [Dioscorea zingiberensis]|uniref:Uncharacterized protein n=1 Tax=Dioscorea zingiberensis TaxID=325984 RepID=A0A9D5D4B0_9LILI|nr:hypothetical protein J5N97_003487 [Dioscorea zingiberensis]
MELVAAGSTLSIKTHDSAATAAPYVVLPLFMQTEKKTQEQSMHTSDCFKTHAASTAEDEGVSSESSSLGHPGESSSDEEEVDEVQSKIKKPLMSLNSIEEALPIKRGLSNFFSGKSKSFACLSDVITGRAEDLVKQENPFNKRRRILMASKNSWSRRASYNSLIGVQNSSLPSLLCSNFTVEEEREDEENHEKGVEDHSSPLTPSSSSLAPLSKHDTKIYNKSFKPPRSFSLSDLQHV